MFKAKSTLNQPPERSVGAGRQTALIRCSGGERSPRLVWSADRRYS
jgi:hypothetical protein